MITSKDGTQIYYKDWGRGPVVTYIGRHGGAPHGLTTTHQDRINADLLAFLRS